MAFDAPDLINASKRVAIKVGSSLLTGHVEDRRAWLRGLSADVKALVDHRHVIIVSSGAVALGKEKLPPGQQHALSAKQAAAAIGQPLLMQAWGDALAAEGLETAQLLLSIGDTESRKRWLNARATVEQLFRASIVPVVNENDSVATEELRYGDNDRLSARVAQMVGADLLILLSDVDGLYTADPRTDPSARHISTIEELDQATFALAGGAVRDGVGTGGMKTKLEAARLAQHFGCSTIIASGIAVRPLAALLDESARATIIPARGTASSAYKAWIAASLSPGGSVTVDEGAVAALRRGGSLLPSGITTVSGEFGQGETIMIVDQAGSEVARGISRYTAQETRQIAGLRALQIEAKLGYSRGDELIHRDDLVLR